MNCTHNLGAPNTCDNCDLGTFQSPNFPGPYGTEPIKYKFAAPQDGFSKLIFYVLRLALDEKGDCVDTVDVYRGTNPRPYKRFNYLH